MLVSAPSTGSHGFRKKHFVGGENDRAAVHTRGLRCPHNEWSSATRRKFPMSMHDAPGCRGNLNEIVFDVSFISPRETLVIIGSLARRVYSRRNLESRRNYRGIVFYEFFVSALRVSQGCVCRFWTMVFFFFFFFFFFIPHSNSSFSVLFVCRDAE